MRGGTGSQEIDPNPELGVDAAPETGTQDTEYVQCEPLTAITSATGAQSPTND